MDSLYSGEISQLFHSVFQPARKQGLQAVVTEEEHNLQLVLFRDNFNAFTREDQVIFSQMVKQFMETVRGMGVPIYMQVAPGSGADA